MGRLRLSILLLLACLCLGVSAHADSSPARILLISPFNASYVQFFQTSSAYIEQLNRSGESYSIDQLYLESAYPPYAPEKAIELQGRLEEIRQGKYRIVVAFSGVGLDLIRNELDTIPASVSVIVCGLTDGMQDALPVRGNVHYIPQQVRLRENLELIERLFPGRHTVFLVTPWNLKGRECRRQAMALRHDFPQLRLIIPDNEKMDADELLAMIGECADDAVVLFQGWYNRRAINASSILHIFNLFGNSDLPVFVMHTALLQYRTVGGYMEDGVKTGIAAAAMTIRLLAGEHVPRVHQPLPVKLYLKEPMLVHYGIDPGKAPDHAKYLGRYESFPTAYREYVWLGAITILCLLLITGVSIFAGLRYRRLIRQLRDVFTSLQMRILVVDEKERILLYHSGNGLTSHASLFSRHIRGIDDFPEDVRGMIRSAIRDVFNTGRQRVIEYDLGNRRQIGTFVQLPREVFNTPAVIGTGVDIDDIHNLTLNEKIQKECMAAVLPDNNANASFTTILRLFCEHFHGDRCYLVRHGDDQGSRPEVVDEYCANGVEPIVASFIGKYHSPYWGSFLSARGHSLIEWIPFAEDQDDAERSRPRTAGERQWLEILRGHRVRRLYVMQIFLHGRAWGIWGLSFRSRSGSLSEIQKQVIPTIARMIELILMRQEYINELSCARDQAQSAARAKSTFLATMSHELRTPLNAVIGYSELLEECRGLPGSQREYAGGIRFAARSLLGLINNILDFSKIESEQMKVVLAPVNVQEIFDELRMTYRQMAADKSLSLSFECPPMPSLMLDVRYVRQILVNLVGNAIKFTDRGSVKVRALYESRVLSIAVSDTGCGIPAEMQSMIFCPFVQSERRDSAGNGTGLGLTISQRLARIMGGDLAISSQPGSGSTFTLVLNDVHPSGDAVVPQEPNPGADHRLAALESIPHVLLVDDSPINIRVFEAMFKTRGIPVIKAASGEEALGILRSTAVDIVFTDLRMPAMSGDELARRIHAIPSLSRLKVVAVTADILFNNEDQEFDAILLKPVSLSQLMSTMHKLLQ